MENRQTEEMIIQVPVHRQQPVFGMNQKEI